MIRRIDRTIVQQTGASVATGSAVARVQGLHPLLFVKIALAWVGTRPGSFGANAFTLHAFDRNAAGDLVQLSGTPLNGNTGQPAPDAWEGQTALPEIQLTHSYAGLANAGRWQVMVAVAPAAPMCDADFQALAANVAILGADTITLP